MSLSAFGVEHTVISKKSWDKDDRKQAAKLGGAAVVGGAGVAAFPARVDMPSTNGASQRVLGGDPTRASTADLRRIVQGEGGRFGNEIHTARLAEKIGEGGKNFLPDNPVEVTRYKNGEAMVTGGHHRVRAAEMQGMGEMPIKILESNEERPHSRTPLFNRNKFRNDVEAARRPTPKMDKDAIHAKATESIPKWQEGINNIKAKAEIGHKAGKYVERYGKPKFAIPAAGTAAAGTLAYKNRDDITERMNGTAGTRRH